MLKNKFKTLLIILFVVLLSLSSFSFADLEEDLVESEVVDGTESTTESIDELPVDVKNFITDTQKPSLVSNNTLISNNDLISNNTTVETKKGDVYLAGTDFNINYDVEGNVYILGTNVTISSRILGNVFVCANTINVTRTGYISNSFYGAANNINFLGKAYDIYTTSNSFYFEGSTFRDIHSIANNLTLNGEIGRNADVAGEVLSFSGKILGDLHYKAKEPISIPNGVVSGNTTYEKIDEFSLRPNYVILAVSFVGLILVLWLFMKWLTPRFLSNTGTILSQAPLKTFGLGFLGLIVIPGIAVLLMLTIAAALAGVLLLGTYMILACISSSIAVIAYNNIIARKLKCDKGYKEFLLLIVISIVAWLLTIIPYIGGAFATVLAIDGFGIVIRNLLKKGQFAEEE